jgi:hypothetical protein
MRILLLFIFITLTAFQCSNDEELLEDVALCSTKATMRDLTGLDGCGFVFELEDGTRLEPLRVFWCGTPPLPEAQTNDPLYDIQWADGRKVLIDYELVENAGSYCMVGPVARITCLTDDPDSFYYPNQDVRSKGN